MMHLVQISPSFCDGKLVGFYFLYQLNVQRGIKGKTKSKVNELLIYGIPVNRITGYFKQNKEEIEKFIKENQDEQTRLFQILLDKN